MLLALALAAAAPTPQPSAPPQPTGAQPGTQRTFGDWTMACDNGGRCQASALAPEGQDGPLLMLQLTRGPEAAAPPTLADATPLEDGPAKAVTVDGAPALRLGDAPVPLDRAALDRLLRGRTASAGSRTAPRVASLRGLAAAALAIDAAQGRVGTATALVRPGTRALAGGAVPLPVVAIPPPSPQPPRTIDVTAATRLLDRNFTDCDAAEATPSVEAARLDAGHSLLVIAPACHAGAYNFVAFLWTLDETGRLLPARFDRAVDGEGRWGPTRAAAAGDPFAAPNALTNPRWDARAGRLTFLDKARGPGDCGATGAYAWDGAGFRLVEAAQMTECRGSIAFLTVWRAAVREGAR